MDVQFYSLHMICESCIWFDNTIGWKLLDALAAENNA